jgi:hypothetical protein
MIFRISAFHRFLFSSSLGICFFITACATTVNTPIPASQSICISPTPEINPYFSHPILPEVTNIYSKILTDPAGARQDALSQLGKNAQHWSDQVNIATDDTHMVRIMITYLDPVLIQYIVLNDVLNSYIPGINTPESNDYLNYRISNALQKLGQRNEFLFLVTITSPFYREQAYNNAVLTVRLPIEQLALVSTADVRVTPVHEDHILDENMDITHGPIHGIVGFPLAIQTKTECLKVIDEFTTTLTLDVPSVTLGNNNAPFGVQFWHIPFQPLVAEKDIHPTPTYDPYYASNPVNPLATPPTPYWEPNAQTDHTDWTAYWNDMGRYIWNVVIAESYH